MFQAGTFGFDSGNGCEPCNCGEGATSSECNPANGQCQCDPSVGGRTCDRCEDGYWNLGPFGCESEWNFVNFWIF